MIIQEKCSDTALDYQGIQWRSYLTKDLLHELLRRVTLFPLLHLFTSPKVSSFAFRVVEMP